jgi:hypothetical protein
MQPKLIIAFDTLSEINFFSKAQLIDTSLNSTTGTANFPPPWPASLPTPAMLHTSFLAYQSAYDAADGGDTNKIALRVAARDALTVILKRIAPYLEIVANGNVPILETTGYDLRHDIIRSQSSDPLPAPDNFQVVRGDLSGVLIASSDVLDGAGSFVTQLCTGDPAVAANWTDFTTTLHCSRVELAGLTPGKIYYVRMCGIGVNGRGVWTNAISIMVV